MSLCIANNTIWLSVDLAQITGTVYSGTRQRWSIYLFLAGIIKMVTNDAAKNVSYAYDVCCIHRQTCRMLQVKEYLKVGIYSSKWVNYILCVTLDQSDWSKNENCGLDIINHNNLLKLIEDSFYICNVFRKENPQTSLYLVQNTKCFLVYSV